MSVLITCQPRVPSIPRWLLCVSVTVHSYINRLARYALQNRSVNLDLDHDCYAVTFLCEKGVDSVTFA